MATLEKIRSKSVFLIVVIGVALLAFIIGDALTNSQNIFGDRTTVAKIGSTKIDFTEYQQKREELNNQLEQARRQNPASVANFDNQLLPQMALTQLIQETLVTDAANKAGIRATGNLLRFYMLDNPQNPEVMKVIQQLNSAGVSASTPQQAYEIIFNPKRNGLTDAQMEPFQRLWLAAENQTKVQVAQSIYARLLQNSVKANDLDKKALYNDYVNTQNVDLAYLPFGNLDPKTYPVSADELKAAYAEKKELFKVEEPTKDMSFISVSIAPSEADRKAARALASSVLKELSDSGAQISKELKKQGVVVSRHSLRASDIPSGAAKDFVLSGSDSAKLVSENISGFTIVKNVSRKAQVDSIQVNIVGTATIDLGKKILAALNGGLPIDSISTRYSTDSVFSQIDQWIPLYTAQGPTNAIPDATLDSLRNAGGKYISIDSGAQGMTMASIVKQNAPVTVYEYDEAVYTLGPSAATMNAEREKLEKFLAANTTAENFEKNAQKAGYNVQRFSVTQSTPAVPRMMGMNAYFPESRQVIRWVMIEAKDGQVSHIYEAKDPTNPSLYVAAVERSYDEYTPLSNPDVTETLTAEVRRDKAGDKLLAQYSKKTQSLQSAAQAMNVEVRNLPTFRFGQNYNVTDPEVMGKIAGSKADKKVAIVKGDNGIYVYHVMGVSKEKFPFNDQSYEQQYYQLVNPDLIRMIQGTAKIKNNIYKFEAGD